MKNKNDFSLALFLLLMVFLFLPIVQQAFHPFKFNKLKGTVVKTEKPALSYDTYKDMSYQSQLEKYVSEQFGFREPIIRSYNQYLWMFRKTYSQDIVIGKDKWLYGNKSVLDHFRQLSCSYAKDNEALVKRLDNQINYLKKAQRILDKRDTKLFVLICPSKDLIYPEHLPDNGNYAMGDGLRAIEYVPEAFAKNGINFLDLNAWFLQIRDTVDYPLFPKTGMHWSNVAAMHASDTLIRYMEHLTGKNMPNISVGKAYPSETVRPDDDLEKILNLIWTIKPNQNYYAEVNVVPDSTAQRLHLITIGDSYFWNIAYTMPMDSLFESYPYWYYYNTVYYDSPHNNVKQLNMVDEINRADAVMILLTTNHLYDFFGGFLNRVIKTFNPSDEVMETILADITIQIENNGPWLQQVEQRAKERGITLEEMKRATALYVYKANPDKYLSRIEAKALKEAEN